MLAAIGVRRDGQKVLLSIKNMGGESTAAWRQFMDDLDARGLKRPEFVIVDGAPGLRAVGLARCLRKGTGGDAAFAVLCACGHHLRKILVHLGALSTLLPAALPTALGRPGPRHHRPVTA